MTSCARHNFGVCGGATFAEAVQWAVGPYIIKAISGITKAASAVVTAVGHGVPDGWPVAIVGVAGMTQINADQYPPRGGDWQTATVLATDSVGLNNVSSALFSTYLSGGFLVYPTPVDLAGMTAIFQVFNSPDMTGTPLLSLAVGTGITLDNTKKRINITFATAALTWAFGYYKLAMTDTSSVVHNVLEGTVTIE